jgi:CAAX prenyl protease-like protein
VAKRFLNLPPTLEILKNNRGRRGSAPAHEEMCFPAGRLAAYNPPQPGGTMPAMQSSRYPMIAYVAPFVLFMAFTMVESRGWLALSYETVYTSKIAVVAATLWVFRRQYPPVTSSGFLLGAISGAVGLVVWIALDWIQKAIPDVQLLVESVMQGNRAGYDPFAGDSSAAARTAFIGIRLIGLVIVVPIMEEIFWRGFLARYLIADDFRKVAQGTFTTFSFVIVTVAFASVHPEVLAALAWGAMINWLYHKTANLWACIVMHAVTNALLGAYILATGTWQLW